VIDHGASQFHQIVDQCNTPATIRMEEARCRVKPDGEECLPGLPY
jgi:hypothetical protein